MTSYAVAVFIKVIEVTINDKTPYFKSIASLVLDPGLNKLIQ